MKREVLEPKIPKLLTISAAAKALGVSRPTVYKLIAGGKLPAKRMICSGSKGRIVILDDELQKYIAALPTHLPSPER